MRTISKNRELSLLLALLLIPSLSYAISDRDNTDIHTKQSQYSPNWVIPAVYNQASEAQAIAIVDKKNVAEQRGPKSAVAALPVEDIKNEKSDVEAQLPIKKKKSASGGSESKAIFENPNIRLEVNGASIDPENMTNMRNFAIARGEETMSYGTAGQTITTWTEEGGVFYRINNQDGSIFGAVKNILATNHTVPTEVLNGEGWDSKAVDRSYTFLRELSKYGDYYLAVIATYSYSNKNDFLSATEIDGSIVLSPSSSGLNYGQLQPLHASYDYHTGDYSFDFGTYRYLRQSDGTYSYKPEFTGIKEGGREYVPPTVKYETTYNNYLNNFIRHDPYEYSYYSNEYNRNNTSYSMPYSNNNKEDASRTGIATDKGLPLSQPTIDSNNNADNYKLYNPYLIDLSFLDPSSLKTKTNELEDLILVLDNKESKTKIEENILIVARAIEENMAYLDQKTIKDFTEVVRIVQAIEDMKSMISSLDFANIAKSLTKLVEEERSMYNDYLKSSGDIYESIIKLLGLNLDDVNLPDSYLSLNEMNMMAKKKIAVDMAIQRLNAKSADTLTDNEKAVLSIDQNLLSPVRGEYISKLKIAVTEFVWQMRDITKDKAPVSFLSDKTGLETIFALKDEPENLSAARHIDN